MEAQKRLEEEFGANGNINGDNGQKITTASDAPKEEQPMVKHKMKRVATLDAFRGLTIVVRIDKDRHRELMSVLTSNIATCS